MIPPNLLNTQTHATVAQFVFAKNFAIAKFCKKKGNWESTPLKVFWKGF